jgi:hypothetical protein
MVPVRRFVVCLGLLVCGVLAAAPAHAQDAPRFEIEGEGGGLWQARNDVRIPNDGGTRFSLVNLIGTGPSGLGRVTATWNITERHGLRATYAPLRVIGSGVPETVLQFAGEAFAAGVPVEAVYDFTSYRVTYRFRVFEGDTWTWRVGGTAFVRDARVALEQGALSAEDTDVGVVPLGHVSGEARLGPRWELLLELDASAAPQGRAIDFSGRVRYALTDRWSIGAGYRTIEGGADVTQVFNFAWLNAAVGTVAVRF